MVDKEVSKLAGIRGVGDPSPAYSLERIALAWTIARRPRPPTHARESLTGHEIPWHWRWWRTSQIIQLRLDFQGNITLASRSHATRGSPPKARHSVSESSLFGRERGLSV